MAKNKHQILVTASKVFLDLLGKNMPKDEQQDGSHNNISNTSDKKLSTEDRSQDTEAPPPPPPPEHSIDQMLFEKIATSGMSNEEIYERLSDKIHEIGLSPDIEIQGYTASKAIDAKAGFIINKAKKTVCVIIPGDGVDIEIDAENLENYHDAIEETATEINDKLKSFLGDDAKNYKISYTGYSAGAALADCAASNMSISLRNQHSDYQIQDQHQQNKISSITFDNPGTQTLIEKMHADAPNTAITDVSYSNISNEKNAKRQIKHSKSVKIKGENPWPKRLFLFATIVAVSLVCGFMPPLVPWVVAISQIVPLHMMYEAMFSAKAKKNTHEHDDVHESMEEAMHLEKLPYDKTFFNIMDAIKDATPAKDSDKPPKYIMSGPNNTLLVFNDEEFERAVDIIAEIDSSAGKAQDDVNEQHDIAEDEDTELQQESQEIENIQKNPETDKEKQEVIDMCFDMVARRVAHEAKKACNVEHSHTNAKTVRQNKTIKQKIMRNKKHITSIKALVKQAKTMQLSQKAKSAAKLYKLIAKTIKEKKAHKAHSHNSEHKT